MHCVVWTDPCKIFVVSCQLLNMEKKKDLLSEKKKTISDVSWLIRLGSDEFLF